MRIIQGIVIHQTGGATAQSSLSSVARSNANGAHFLIDRDGTIYQTASVYRQTWHVGSIKSRCVMEFRCTTVELAALRQFDPRGEHRREMKKLVPDRYPSNRESIGIEIVGGMGPASNATVAERGIDEKVNAAQNASLKWLVQARSITIDISMKEIFRHPAVSRKNPTEAATASW